MMNNGAAWALVIFGIIMLMITANFLSWPVFIVIVAIFGYIGWQAGQRRYDEYEEQQQRNRDVEELQEKLRELERQLQDKDK